MSASDRSKAVQFPVGSLDEIASWLAARITVEVQFFCVGIGGRVKFEQHAMVYHSAISHHPIYFSIGSLHQPSWVFPARNIKVPDFSVVAGGRFIRKQDTYVVGASPVSRAVQLTVFCFDHAA